jgi:uncharacterized membrane protein HdeD (DUF308 family)
MFRKLINPKSPLYYLFIFLIIFAGAATMIHGAGSLDDNSQTLLAVTSFVFGFYVSDLLSNARSSHIRVVESLREEGGSIRAIYFSVKSCFDSNTVNAVRKKIDQYLMAGMDYRVYDYAKSSEQFVDLYSYIMQIDPKTPQQINAHGQITDIIGRMSENRGKVETMVKERVSPFEWLTISTMLTLVLYFVYNLNSGTILSVILTSTIATSLTMLLVVLYGLDSFRWKEDKWFWSPLEELFESMDLIPYYPEVLVTAGRIKLEPGKPVRLATYPNPYPDITNKRINKIDRWNTNI